MFNSDKIRQGALAALLSVVFTVTAVGAAVGPARSVETSPVTYAAVETDILRG